LPGDAVIGFITKGYGISIHKKDCPNVTLGLANEENRARWVEAHWDVEGGNEREVYEASLQVMCEDRIGMFADISAALADMRVPIMQINTQKTPSGTMSLVLKIACKNTSHYNSIMSRLKSIKDVIDVVRGYS
jgi:GTP pyrophosphokinase